MSAPTETALSWIRQIPGDLYVMDEKPLLGYPPAFPWQEFAAYLDKIFQIQGLAIQPEDWAWRPQAELFAGLGEDVRGQRFSLAPVPGTLWWGMAHQEIERLMQLLLANEETQSQETAGESPIDQIDQEFTKTFYRFVAMQALNAFVNCDFDKKLAPTLSQEEGLPSESCLCLDLSFSLANQTFYGRLFLSNEFRKNWVQRYLAPKSAADKYLYAGHSLDIPIHLQVGRVKLSLAEWQQTAIGDLILLDSCSFDPVENKGSVSLIINGAPFFLGRIKQGSIKLLEHPYLYEVDSPMDKSSDNPSKNNEDLDKDFDDAEEEFDIGDEDLSEVDEVEAPPPAPAAKEKATTAPPPQEAPAPEVHAKMPSIDDLPINIVVEVGRIQMSLQKIVELQPGNMLELEVHPEAGVDLVVNGKRIAKGELLRIGDALGVRIVQFS